MLKPQFLNPQAKRATWLFFVLAVLSYSQAASQLHAVEHPFHNESTICDTFLVIQNDSEGAVPGSGMAKSPFIATSLIQKESLSQATRRYEFLTAIRAPPYILHHFAEII